MHEGTLLNEKLLTRKRPKTYFATESLVTLLSVYSQRRPECVLLLIYVDAANRE